jgi:hypothetical protein
MTIVMRAPSFYPLRSTRAARNDTLAGHAANRPQALEVLDHLPRQGDDGGADAKIDGSRRLEREPRMPRRPSQMAGVTDPSSGRGLLGTRTALLSARIGHQKFLIKRAGVVIWAQARIA